MTLDEQNLLSSEKCEDPLGISLPGQQVAPVISPTLPEPLKGNQQSLVEFIRKSPMYGLDDLGLERNDITYRQTGGIR